ncbi:hypothetical protein GIB67_031637 [Kingdonia uniflora]|uniref:Ubiquitin-like domain-containing protein n=1 Tax=Kingdonia uniflora TaxID=39325 RepID=A0A7J7LYC1_9MAGN|nr:hypothetical protein GIB67_031637 [Kingdonia uniflora]
MEVGAMGSNNTDEVMVSEDAECSETTVEIKIKTLDSQTYTLRVNKRVPVPELKEQIQTVTGVVSEQQRLICRGKVLKDDQLLSAYHVEDGHTLHLVVRQPFFPSSASAMGSDSLPDQETDLENRGDHVSHSVVFRTFNVADQGEGGMPDLNREPVLERVERTDDPSGISSSTQTEHDTGFQLDPLLGFRHPTEATWNRQQPPVIPDSLTILSQYLRHLRHEFSANGLDESNHTGNVGVRGGEEAPRSVSGQGLPTPASLAEVLIATRRLLVEQVASCIWQLSRRLENQAGVANPSLRSSIQTNAVRLGALLQNLGALLLELGRTTMTLQIGQIPTDAVVNAGPPIFISSSGPNPIMVQPLPFQPGLGFGATSMGTGNPGSGFASGSAGSGFLPRNIDIRIRTGSSIGPNNVNQGERTGGQQNPAPTGTTRGSGAAGFVQQVAATGTSRGPTITLESGVRVTPVRTVITAVPASVGRPSSDSSRSSTGGMFFPILARVQHVPPVQTNNIRGSQSSVPEYYLQRSPDVSVQQQNLGSNSGAPVTSESTPTQQRIAGGANVEEATPSIQGYASREGIHFSRILRQIMPYISHMPATGPGAGFSSERVDTSDNGVSQHSTQNDENQADPRARHRHDDHPSTQADSKRQKKE